MKNEINKGKYTNKAVSIQVPAEHIKQSIDKVRTQLEGFSPEQLFAIKQLSTELLSSEAMASRHDKDINDRSEAAARAKEIDSEIEQIRDEYEKNKSPIDEKFQELTQIITMLSAERQALADEYISKRYALKDELNKIREFLTRRAVQITKEFNEIITKELSSISSKKKVIDEIYPIKLDPRNPARKIPNAERNFAIDILDKCEKALAELRGELFIRATRGESYEALRDHLSENVAFIKKQYPN